MARSRTHPNPALVLVKLIGALVVAGVLGAGLLLPYVGGIGLASKSLADRFLNTKCTLHETPPPQKTEVYANDGKTLIATIFKQDRQPIPLSQVPSSLQKALVATEDRRFYSHHGVDMRGLLRSAINTSSGDTQGGSTLTMQYVKQIRYYQAGDNKKKQAAAIAQNLDRKIEDAKCALHIENIEHESKSHDPRQLPQHRVLRRELLRHRDGGRDLLRQDREPADAARVGDARRPASRPDRVRPVHQPWAARSTARRGAAEPRLRRRHLPGASRQVRRPPRCRSRPPPLRWSRKAAPTR